MLSFSVCHTIEKTIQWTSILSQGGYHLQHTLLDRVSFPLVQEDVRSLDAAWTIVILTMAGFLIQIVAKL